MEGDKWKSFLTGSEKREILGISDLSVLKNGQLREGLLFLKSAAECLHTDEKERGV